LKIIEDWISKLIAIAILLLLAFLFYRVVYGGRGVWFMP
jgi:hypothetical protein